MQEFQAVARVETYGSEVVSGNELPLEFGDHDDGVESASDDEIEQGEAFGDVFRFAVDGDAHGNLAVIKENVRQKGGREVSCSETGLPFGSTEFIRFLGSEALSSFSAVEAPLAGGRTFFNPGAFFWQEKTGEGVSDRTDAPCGTAGTSTAEPSTDTERRE